eukprot:COSAG05_NODE_3499_length_2026_cov_1.255838_1_plen_422_part_00
MPLTRNQRRAALQLQALDTLSAFSHALVFPASLAIRLRLLGGEANKLALLSAEINSSISFFILLLSPVVGTLSDSFGRLPFRYASALAQVLWPLSMSFVSSVRMYQANSIFVFGIMSAGGVAVREAVLDDTFAEDAVLRARVAARSNVLTSACRVLGPTLSSMLIARSARAVLPIAALVAALQLPLLAVSDETLSKQRRLPFALRKAEPISNIGILFRNGRDLRHFTVSMLIRNFALGAHSVQTAHMIGVLGWSAAQTASFVSVQACFSMMSQSTIAVPMMRQFGSKRCYEVAGYFSAGAFILTSQSHRPQAASLQLCMLLLANAVNMFSHVAELAGRATLVAHAQHTSTGSGELSAALGGVTNLLGLVVPLFWGHCYKLCTRVGLESRWHSPGGAYVLAALLRFLSTQLSVRGVTPLPLK